MWRYVNWKESFWWNPILFVFVSWDDWKISSTVRYKNFPNWRPIWLVIFSGLPFSLWFCDILFGNHNLELFSFSSGLYTQGHDVTKFASMCKLKAGRLSREVTDACLQYWGGMGYTNEVLISRFFRWDCNFDPNWFMFLTFYVNFLCRDVNVMLRFVIWWEN